ncbi:tigger transposable element-derived protein 1-like protein [Trichonephila clavipes]|nr:tigger transposable element-derived protein 1-like protein [Trichonephila clavipes]
MGPKKHGVSWTVLTKQEMIAKVESGQKMADVARQYGLNSMSIIQEKAREIFEKLKEQTPGSSSEELEFKATTGCFTKFTRRSGIKHVLMHGESARADKEAAEKYCLKFQEYIETEGQALPLGKKTEDVPTQRDKPSHLGEKTEDMLTQRDKPSHLGEKTEDMPTQRDKPSHLGEKTEDIPTPRDKPSHLGVIRRTQMGRLSFAFSLQLVKMLQVSRKSIPFHQSALAYIKVLLHLIMQVVRQGAVMQIPEMG